MSELTPEAKVDGLQAWDAELVVKLLDGLISEEASKGWLDAIADRLNKVRDERLERIKALEEIIRRIQQGILIAEGLEIDQFVSPKYHDLLREVLGEMGP